MPFDYKQLLNEELERIIHKLLMTCLNKDSGLPVSELITKEEVKKLVWDFSILAESNVEEFRNAACSIASMLYFIKEVEGIDLRESAALIMSRSGNTPVSLRLLKDTSISGGVASIEIAKNMMENLVTYEKSKKNVWATKFQKELAKDVEESNVLSISAPTSAGKSFIIQNYLIELIHGNIQGNYLYIVPTKTLINQASNSFRKEVDSDHCKVLTHYNEEFEFEADKSYVFVLTPERCLSLLSSSKSPDFQCIFIDEVQNVGDGDRGVIMEYTLRESHRKWPGAKLLTAGPYLDAPNELITKITGSQAKPATTIFEPIFQLKIKLGLKKGLKELACSLHHPLFEPVSFSSKSKKSLYGKYKNSKVKFLLEILPEFKEGMSLIYCQRQDYAEDRAAALIEILPVIENLPKEVVEFINFLKTEVHPDYQLIECLKRGIAFHHAGLPELVRTELEFLIESSFLRFIFCTSTLLEGVNFPAARMIVMDAKVDRFDMGKFDFMNLAGRAGRISSNFIGFLYCYEQEDEIWSDNYLTKISGRQVSLASTEMLEKFITVNPKLLASNEPFMAMEIDDFEKKTLQNTVIMLRGAKLVNEQILGDLLKSKIVDVLIRNQVEQALAELNISVPEEIIKKNPFIDPLKIDQLNKMVKEEGFGEWLITSKKFKRDSKSADIEREKPFKERNFYFQLERVLEKLDPIFDIMKDIEQAEKFDAPSMRKLVVLATYWIRGDLISRILDREINAPVNKNIDLLSIPIEEAMRVVFGEDGSDVPVPQKRKKKKKSEENNPNAIIRKTTKRINSYVCFSFAKYLSVLTDILEANMKPQEIEENKFGLALPTMIELGSADTLCLQLMSAGVPRSIALHFRGLYPKDFEGDAVAYLRKNAEKKDIPYVYLRYLRRHGFI